jgi:hypothetical protein
LEEVTREVFEKRRDELMKKWKDKFSIIHTDIEMTPTRFYNENKFEMFRDIDELYNMAIILGIKGE